MLILTRPANRKEQFYLYLISSLVILLSCFFYAYTLHPISFIFDDAYIVIHNVQVLISGHDSNYPDVSALDGTTSLVYLALIRLFACFLSPLWALYTVSWLAILIYAIGLLRLAFIYSATNLQAILFLVSGLLIGYTPINLLNGLETGLALAILTWTVIFIITEQRIAKNLLLGLLPFIRPELIFLSFILWISSAPVYWRQQKNIKFVGLNLLMDALTLSMTALPFALWYFIDLGTPYPETLNAKKYFFAEQTIGFSKKLFSAINQLLKFAYSLGVFNFISMIILMLLRPLSRLFLLFFLVFLLLYMIVYPHGLATQAYRYLYLWLPFMLYGVIACTQHKNNLIKIFSNAILIILLTSTLFYFPKHWKNYLHEYHFMTQQHISLKAWCEKNIPPDSTILVQDAGYLAYATDFHLIDLVGLKTPANIRYHRDITFPSAGQKRALAIADIIHATHPQYLMITTEWNRIFHFEKGLKAQGIVLQQKAIVHDYLIYQLN